MYMVKKIYEYLLFHRLEVDKEEIFVIPIIFWRYIAVKLFYRRIKQLFINRV